MTKSDKHGALEVHLRAVSAARYLLEHARAQRDRVEVSAARHRLRNAVDLARDAGATWMQIGDLLGIARGNAYRQYRRRPHRDGDANRPLEDRDSE
jgi:hypothetical protein